ncbi:MAG: PilZ domain-containing protein [Candidatus Omnitrophica bacterium]|nr:PilZ domain-containing protein [Candidatus Omnitrophota bacterium]
MFGRRKYNLGTERRKYIRLDSVFPVQFRLETLDGKQVLSPWIQGFTNNIGHGGICLTVNDLSPELIGLVQAGKVKLAIEINMPLKGRPVRASVSLAWTREEGGLSKRLLLGLDYENINPAQNAMLIRYAWAKKLFLPFVVMSVLILSLFVGVDAYLNMQLVHKNKMLVEELVGVLQESKGAKLRLEQITLEKDSLQGKIESLISQIEAASEKKSEEVPAVMAARVKPVPVAADKTRALNEMIMRLVQERDLLQAKLDELKANEKMAQEEALRLENRKTVLEKANLDKMYQWFKIRQNPRTGLVMSFEGDKDIASWAFLYDQALLIQVYDKFLDFDRARRILDFLAKRAKREDGWFLNAYYVNDGSPAEFVLHCGPNIWLGLSIVQYTQATGDRKYLPIAEEIARNIINLQNSDSDNGIRGGPQMPWYSTEHHLDAYALYKMLAKVTGMNQYEQAADKTLGWLLRHTYDKQELPVKRGKGDSTIATDTYAWSVAAIGPEKLKAIGMDSDKILEFVEENCLVEVNFVRPGGQVVKVKGFDFAPQRHVSRGGVVSSEWTAQMVVSFKIMADYYLKKGQMDKAVVYLNKADNYLAQLGKMIISSPSPSGQGEGCLPYATQDYVDTGHGWMTPKGKHTGSVSGTAYTIFAYYGINPLELK